MHPRGIALRSGLFVAGCTAAVTEQLSPPAPRPSESHTCRDRAHITSSQESHTTSSLGSQNYRLPSASRFSSLPLLPRVSSSSSWCSLSPRLIRFIRSMISSRSNPQAQFFHSPRPAGRTRWLHSPHTPLALPTTLGEWSWRGWGMAVGGHERQNCWVEGVLHSGQVLPPVDSHIGQLSSAASED